MLFLSKSEGFSNKNLANRQVESDMLKMKNNFFVHQQIVTIAFYDSSSTLFGTNSIEIFAVHVSTKFMSFLWFMEATSMSI